ncbi:bcl-2/adenovirus E1B 19 kDa-interacting protein 2-like protein [Sphaeramia orbicularis]|uniref:Bcl-2/adenovirus E1B 19 kDa-interacting protein 2-like protein n=1 Tax=Sphaeramia orbicularis TaxID=375764 RepID=A0A672ZEY0_9TELE|nr:bcl-2/adenovirus E1B 19 kDa-interacting protein 2-like protein [Sphaeramia orbicularis]XP_030002798.1 bcl-2/adenovirus E1B 19 kDa-interacting protein 2-like protein [Sphaeramia orbicularis]
MESRQDEQEEEEEEDPSRSFPAAAEEIPSLTQSSPSNDLTVEAEEETGAETQCAVMARASVDSAGESGPQVCPEEEDEDEDEEEPRIQKAIRIQEEEDEEEQPVVIRGETEDESTSEQRSSTPTGNRPAPPSTLALSGSRPKKKKILVAPALSLSLGRSESTISDDFPCGFLSPSLDDDSTGLDFDLDAIETPSDSESLPFPMYDLDLEDDLRRLGVASRRYRPLDPRLRSGSGSQCGAGLDQEDTVDSQGIRWRHFSTGDPPQQSRVNMSVLEPYLRVLSHGGYYGDGMNDIIVFSSCYLPENNLENYQYVMDNLFRYVVGTLDLMVSENYVIVYLCAGGQTDKLPGISWLRECYTTIHRKLRKNLKGFYVVHPTWYIKALITIIKPFISSKFSRKLQFVDSLQDLSHFIPTEHVQIPDCVRQYDANLSR